VEKGEAQGGDRVIRRMLRGRRRRRGERVIGIVGVEVNITEAWFSDKDQVYIFKAC
jgi:hypothetical protein